MNTLEISGTLDADLHVFEDRPDLVRQPTERIRLDKEATSEAIDLFVCRTPDQLVSSCYLVVDLESRRLMVNQSYDNVGYWFPRARPKLTDDDFTLSSTPIPIEGPHVIIGGPIDSVWYHWLVSWCARFYIVRQLRPDLFEDPAVRFMVCTEARNQFRETALAVGIPEDRITWVTHDNDYLVQDAIVVTFPDQRYLYPEVVRGIAATLKANLAADIEPGRRRIFASRQSFTTPKRRVANWAAIQPVLEAFGFEVVELGQLSARDQIAMFSQAQFVLGVHGSDLANLIFCEPGAIALVIENERNLYHGLSASLDILSGIVGVDYHCMIAEEAIDPDADYSHFPTLHNRDVIIDPDGLRDRLIALGCQPVVAAV
ncbi:hypothetical protein KOAAANKH_01320 [Brevundimonas sp. NIBR10]|uniref:glycosyltransferase family 61 protein n=1 Tax=Brevundimonas sp. NIBR10 TaxID=3015997 RepID=UPI0022F1BC74|nr:glycosyltransferase family 61 protein [Brevundimonas sp. NIBR10]WGM46452.1 hypothetical protein KOAAANKH_01320 [Brevundimonas sp. NIBR10]